MVNLNYGRYTVTTHTTDAAGNGTTVLTRVFVETATSARSINFMVDDEQLNTANSATHQTINDIHNVRPTTDVQDIGERSSQNTLLAKLLNGDNSSPGHQIANDIAPDSSANTMLSDPIDLRELLQDSGYSAANGTINRVATLNKEESKINDDMQIVANDANTNIQNGRNNTDTHDYPTTLFALPDVQTDFANLLNHQQLLII